MTFGSASPGGAELDSVLSAGVRQRPLCDVRFAQVRPSYPPFDAGGFRTDRLPAPTLGTVRSAAAKSIGQAAGRRGAVNTRKQQRERRLKPNSTGMLWRMPNAAVTWLDFARNTIRPPPPRSVPRRITTRAWTSSSGISWLVNRKPSPSSAPWCWIPWSIPRVSRTGPVPYTGLSPEVAVEYELPLQSVIPAERGYKYVANRDEIDALPRPEKEIKDRYARLIAQVAIRAIHESSISIPARDRGDCDLLRPRVHDGPGHGTAHQALPDQRQRGTGSVHLIRAGESRSSSLPAQAERARLKSPVRPGASPPRGGLRGTADPVQVCRGHGWP